MDPIDVSLGASTKEERGSNRDGDELAEEEEEGRLSAAPAAQRRTGAAARTSVDPEKEHPVRDGEGRNVL